ncbi:hypothetical protein SCARD494_03412 [Seiridium cardinale]
MPDLSFSISFTAPNEATPLAFSMSFNIPWAEAATAMTQPGLHDILLPAFLTALFTVAILLLLCSIALTMAPVRMRLARLLAEDAAFSRPSSSPPLNHLEEGGSGLSNTTASTLGEGLLMAAQEIHHKIGKDGEYCREIIFIKSRGQQGTI